MRDRECKEGQGQKFSRLHLSILHIEAPSFRET